MDEAQAKAETTAGQIELLKHNLNEAAIELGEKFGPAVGDFAEGMAKVVSGDWVNGLNMMGGAARELVNNFFSLIGIDLSKMGPMLTGLGDQIRTIAEELAGNALQKGREAILAISLQALGVVEAINNWTTANSGLILGMGGLALAAYAARGALLAKITTLGATRIGMLLLTTAQGAYTIAVGVGTGIIAGLRGAMGLAAISAGGLATTMMGAVLPVLAVGVAIAGVVRQFQIFNDQVGPMRDQAEIVVQQEMAAGN
jgi:hypothetical protein